MPRQLALRKRADGRSLAARRAAFAEQMRQMALSDLSQVKDRLKGLHAELERVDGRKWTHYDLAAKMDIPPRTFQSWENGEVENRDGKGYDKIARFYSRRLGRKITRNWILFGDEPKLVDVATPLNGNGNGEEPELTRERAVAELSNQIGELAQVVLRLEADIQGLLRRSGGQHGEQTGS